MEWIDGWMVMWRGTKGRQKSTKETKHKKQRKERRPWSGTADGRSGGLDHAALRLCAVRRPVLVRNEQLRLHGVTTTATTHTPTSRVRGPWQPFPPALSPPRSPMVLSPLFYSQRRSRFTIRIIGPLVSTLFYCLFFF